MVMRLYDGTIIPANRHIDEAGIAERVARLYRPYHDAYADLAARRPDVVIVAVHSFTPCLKGRAPRPWQVGILHSHLDERLSRALIRRLEAEGDLCVGDNEPYNLAHGRLNTLIEVRNDLIATAEAQQGWADRLARVLVAALADVAD